MTGHIHRHHSRLGRLLILSASLALIAGCGGQASKPTPALHVMGALLIDQTSGEEGPYQVGVAVSLDNQPVTDATVTVNGTPLVYSEDPAHPERTGYGGLVSLQSGHPAVLTVRCSGGERTLQATSPGAVHILSPSEGAAFADSQDIEVSWSESPNASLCVVACGDVTQQATGTWLLSKSATSWTVPAASTAPPGGRITVITGSGQGQMPSADLRDWIGRDGFWVTAQAWVDVQITS